MNLKNKSGITLIALIVTIIVLIIIAGISIATLTADNGVLRQTDSAKVLQIEWSAREQVNLACAAMRLAIAQASAEDNSYSAKENIELIQNKLLEIIKADTQVLESDSWNKGTANTSTGKFVLIYEGEDYKNACNDENALITYTIALAQKNIELINETNSMLKDSQGNDVNVDVTIDIYLVDKVEVGDYVDIGLDYSNQLEFTPGATIALSSDELKGWRVLSKKGTGAEGTVTLISAGVPLTFFHPNTGVSDSSNQMFTDLNKEITLVSGEVQGFVKNAFNDNNLANVWASNRYIDTTKGVHAFSVNELETLYASLTGNTKAIADLRQAVSGEFALKTESMLVYNPNLSEKTNDLLSIGMIYFLAGGQYDSSYLWVGYYTGGINGYRNDAAGIRPVITLNAGILLSDDNSGNGESLASAYKLAE